MLRFIIHFTRGLIREQRTRRSVMFFAMIGTLVWLFLGATFLDAPLRERPFLFVLYWLACAWVTLLVVLLALFDLLQVRAAVRRERRRLAKQFLNPIEPDEVIPPDKRPGRGEADESLKQQNSTDEDAR